MTINRYFNNFPGKNRFTNEHRVMEDVIVESIEIMGHEVYYIPRESYDEGDMIFGEYSKSKFSKAYGMEAYIANVEGFEGDGDFFSKFGLEIRDTSNFIVSRRSFARHLPTVLRERPQEGDLIYVPLMRRMFEIKFIEKKLMFFSLGNKEPYIYEIRCEVFRFSQDNIDTGFTEIDNVADDAAFTMGIHIGDSYSQSYFVKDEIVYQSLDGTWANNYVHASVKQFDQENNILYVNDIAGQFDNNSHIFGNTSTAEYSVVSHIDEKTDLVSIDIFDNKDFDTGADLILDLSETNPFGAP